MSILSGIFGTSPKKAKSLRTPIQVGAEQTLGNILNAPMPEFPTREIAPMSEAESLAQSMVTEYGATEPAGMETLRSYAEPGNILDRPEIQAIIQNVLQSGQQETNRLGRTIQLSGAGSSSSGRDVLGRSVEDTQRMILSTLASYLESAENRRLGAATSMAGISETGTLNRLNRLSTTGSLSRTLQQMQSDAEYVKMMQQINFPYETQSGIASLILNAQNPMAVTGGSASPFSQASPLIATILKGIL
jgi:hypothetical protein